MTTTSTNWQQHLDYLFDAELQFRLTAAVRIATTMQRQPLDFPDQWTHGHVSVTYDEMSLRQDQAESAANLIQHSATLTMAVAVKDAIEALVPDLSAAVRRDGATRLISAVDDAIANNSNKPWHTTEQLVGTTYHIARLIRNAYSHAPFAPRWMINSAIRNMTFSVPNVAELNANGLHGTAFDWRHYGGLLSIYKLCRFTRFEILGDTNRVRKNIPTRQRTLYQLGDLIMEKVDEIPDGYVQAEVPRNDEGSVDLGHGYRAVPAGGDNAE
jgi:hypothetical protein